MGISSPVDCLYYDSRCTACLFQAEEMALKDAHQFLPILHHTVAIKGICFYQSCASDRFSQQASLRSRELWADIRCRCRQNMLCVLLTVCRNLLIFLLLAAIIPRLVVLKLLPFRGCE